MVGNQRLMVGYVDIKQPDAAAVALLAQKYKVPVTMDKLELASVRLANMATRCSGCGQAGVNWPTYEELRDAGIYS
jgi:hypothetical protein